MPGDTLPAPLTDWATDPNNHCLARCRPANDAFQKAVTALAWKEDDERSPNEKRLPTDAALSGRFQARGIQPLRHMGRGLVLPDALQDLIECVSGRQQLGLLAQ